MSTSATATSQWALVVDGSPGQNRSAVAAVRALAQAGYRAAVTVSGRYSLAATSRFCSRTVPTPLPHESGFASAVHAETAARQYLTVLPASDAAIVGLQAPGRELIDKNLLASLAAEVGFRVPGSTRYERIEDLLAAATDLDYPCVVKPALKNSAGHRPARRVDRPKELAEFGDACGPFIVQPFLPGEVRAAAGVMWKGRLVAAVHQRHLRLWPPVCGDACAAVTTAPDPHLEAQLEQLLGDYDGIFQAEFVGPHLLDVNPRVYGSMPLAVSAGVNPVGVYCGLLLGAPVPALRGRAGVRYRWWEGDVRNLYARRGRPGEVLSSALREWRGARSQPARSPTDLGPAMMRLRYALHRRRPGPVTS